MGRCLLLRKVVAGLPSEVAKLKLKLETHRSEVRWSVSTRLRISRAQQIRRAWCWVASSKTCLSLQLFTNGIDKQTGRDVMFDPNTAVSERRLAHQFITPGSKLLDVYKALPKTYIHILFYTKFCWDFKSPLPLLSGVYLNLLMWR